MRLPRSQPMLDAPIEEIDGREVRIGDRWLADFASCGYLGLDLDEEIIDAVPEYLARWGTCLSWPSPQGSPVLHAQIEARLGSLLDAQDALVLQTVADAHLAAIPILAGGGTLFLDARANHALRDACAVAQARGATVRRFDQRDPDTLHAALLRRDWRRPGMVCLDSVDGATGGLCDLPSVAALARAHGLLVYVDDAHGFGVLGERRAGEPCPYGVRGNGIVRHLGQSWEGMIVVGSFARAYSSTLAFIACPTAVRQVLRTAAPACLGAGATPVASLATVLEGLRVNELRGERLRARLHTLAARVLDRVRELGIHTPSRSSFPIVALPLADPDARHEVGELLLARGIYAPIGIGPPVPREQIGLRIALTAANTDEQVDRLRAVLCELASSFKVSGDSAD